MGKDNHTHNHSSDDRFSKLMFGDRKPGMSRRHHDVPKDDQSTLDLGSLLDNIDKLRDSSQNLKPLFQMVYPFVQQFLKKK
jgi:hypothetical protein